MSESVEKHLTRKCWPRQGQPTLPIALLPIGKAGRGVFRIRLRDGEPFPAPESLPTKSEIGDGR